MTLREVDPRQAYALLAEGWVYVDVRAAPEFAEARPAGSVNVEWQRVGASGFEANPVFVDEMARRFGKDARLVVACKASGRGRRAATALVAAGFTNVVFQRAGFDGVRDHFGRVVEPGWSRLELPVERG